MNELLAYINMIKKLIDNDSEKETVFYNDGEWYSRSHSRNISLKELEEWVLSISQNMWYLQEELMLLKQFIDSDTLDKFENKYFDENGNLK